MRTVEIRRHSFTKKGAARGRGSHLSREGVTAARALGTSLGPFELVLASTSPRTMETAIAMGVAVNDLIEMPSPVETGEIEFHSWREWDDPFTTLQARALASPAVRAYMTRQADNLLAATNGLTNGRSALVVGHGGWIESVIAHLVEPAVAAQLGGSFWHLDGIRLTIDETLSVSVDAVDRHPREPDRHR